MSRGVNTVLWLVNVLSQGYEEVKDVQIVQAGLYIYGLVPALKTNSRREVFLQLTVLVLYLGGEKGDTLE